MLDGKRVLTVDDSASIRFFLRGLLASQGVKVVDQASSAAEGLEMFERALAGEHYDLLLLDLVLPDTEMDGMALLRHMRAKDDACTIVMLSGAEEIHTVVEAIRAGADGYIPKKDLVVSDDYAAFFYALEQALGQRSGVAARKELERLKMDFYSMITHDLRNPAGTISLSTRILLDDDTLELPDYHRELVQIAHQSAEKLLGLINDFLDYAKIEAGYLQLSRQMTNLSEVVEKTVRRASVQAQGNHQTLRSEIESEPLVANVDGRRLQQVFENLIANAIKYTQPGGQIVARLATEGQEVVFEVSDNGPGIPPAVLPKLFQKYQRAPGDASQRIRGTGLGLVIVKEIVQAHGGQVSVQSTGVPGEGSTFTVRIPIEESDEFGPTEA